MDAEFTGQLIDSMAEAVSKLQKISKKKRKNDVVKLKTLILDLHRQIGDSLEEKNA